jgi:UDP:flavonoid glycosyltransferase YjiC (YdhE family)
MTFEGAAARSLRQRWLHSHRHRRVPQLPAALLCYIFVLNAAFQAFPMSPFWKSSTRPLKRALFVGATVLAGRENEKR